MSVSHDRGGPASDMEDYREKRSETGSGDFVWKSMSTEDPWLVSKMLMVLISRHLSVSLRMD